MKTLLVSTIPLFGNYRKQDFLGFHRRDSQMIAERVGDNSLEKGIIWKDYPACLTLKFRPKSVKMELAIDGKRPPEDLAALIIMVKHMLGLAQNTAEFESVFNDHPHIGRLIACNPGLRVPLSATPFEALSWAIIGQQISVSAAISIRRRFILAMGIQHSSGLWCHPTPARIVQFNEDILRAAGFSQAKTKTLLALSQAIVQNDLDLDIPVNTESIERLGAQLLKIRGIGPWTINYALLRGFGWLDGSLHGDVAVRNNLRALLGTDKITEQETRQWLAHFSPWRALVAVHLWAMSLSVHE